MIRREAMDYIIRDTLRCDVGEQEPSADVRDSLLAKAEARSVQTEQVVGTSIPPLISGLRDVKPTVSGSVRLPEVEADFMDLFGAAQQRLVTVWLLSLNTRY